MTRLPIGLFVEYGAGKRPGRVPAPAGKLGPSPEVVPVDVPVGEIHSPRVGLIAVFAGYVRVHGEAARDDGPLGAAQGKEIRLGGGGAKVVGREGMPAHQNVDAITLALDFHGRCGTGRR